MALIPLNTFKTKTAVLTTLKYNQVRCARDTALIVDSIAYDLIYGGNTQSTFAAVQYWAQGSSNIPGDIPQTLAAMEHAKKVIVQILNNQTITKSTSNSITQPTPTAPAASAGDINIVISEIDLIMDIIENGISGVTDRISPNQSSGVSSRAATILATNKSFIQNEIVAYVKDNLIDADYTYDKTKCRRDLKLIIDSIVSDLRFGGNTQSTFAGLQYWSMGATQIANETLQTQAAITHLKSLVGQVILNESIDKTEANTQSQVINNTKTGTTTSKDVADGLFDTLLAILVDAADGTRTNDVSNLITANSTLTTDTGMINAYQAIISNKLFLQEEIVKWIDAQTTTPFDNVDFIAAYDDAASDTCFRDVGYILDCICFDMKYGGNRQTIQAGVYYNGFDQSTSILAEKSFAINAYKYLKRIIGDVIQGLPITTVYQDIYKQDISLPAGGLVQANIAVENLNHIIDIIIDNPTTVEKKPISLNQLTDKMYALSAGALVTNETFLIEEVIAYIDNINNTSFNYPNSTLYNDTNKCFRDMGYIIDCISFDLTHGGNRQAIQAGVYYYGHSSTTSIVPTEKSDTLNAYNYMRYVIENVLTSTSELTSSLNYPAAPYQTETQKVSLAVSSSTVNTSASALITTLNTIINAGPPSTSPTPISLTKVTDTSGDLDKAFNLLQANKPYIVAEVIGYMNSLKTPNTTKIYTAPPGVTAIILMAQVANVTDHDINITFAHYRNIPVYADPSTLNGAQPGDTITELVDGFSVPANDSASLIQGKMIIEAFDSIIAYASEGAGLKVTLSILETANA
jgi:hypothetical protein